MSSRKQYRPWAPDQTFLLPPSPRDWLPAEHLAYFILDVADTLDLGEIVREIHAKDPRGTQPYDPRLMVALLIYGYCTGVRSSRAIERATYEDIPFRVIAGECHPDHATISEFRRQHLKAFRGLFLAALKMCQEAGLVKLGNVALDGTKISANASKHKAMSYERMKRTEAELSAEVQQLLAEAEQADAAEDAKHGKGRRGDELPEELSRRESRLAKLRAAKAALEAEAARTRADTVAEQARRAREKAEAEADEGEREKLARAAERASKKAADAEALAAKQAEKASGPASPTKERAAACSPEAADLAVPDDVGPAEASAQEGVPGAVEAEPGVITDPPSHAPKDGEAPPALPHHRVKATKEGLPHDKAQRNFTDPDSRIMGKGKDFVQAYNGQIVVDEAHQIILATALTNQAADPEHLPYMLDQTLANCEAAPQALTADAGYFSAENAAYAAGREVDAFIAVQRQKRQEQDSEDNPAPLPDDSDARQKMAEKLRTPEGKAAYARRKAIVEPVFGQMKEAMGFRRFLVRGLDKARGEWDLAATAHNLLKLFRATVKAQAPQNTQPGALVPT